MKASVLIAAILMLGLALGLPPTAKAAELKVLAGGSRDSLGEVASGPWSAFETALVVQERGPYFAVQPLDAAGNVLATSAATVITNHGKTPTVKHYGCGSSQCGY